MSARPRLRPATAGDIKAFYPTQGVTMRAIVAELAGEPVGLAGLAYPPGGVIVVSVVRPALRAFPLAILAGAKIVTGWARDAGALAIAEPDYPDAPRLLEWLGFDFLGETAQGKVYGWKR
jgi:hypothetical protein